MTNTLRIQLSAAMTKSDVANCINNPDITIIQTNAYLSDEVLLFLNQEVFSKRPHIEFRIYGFNPNKVCDLAFLRHLYHVQNLNIDCNDDITHVEILNELKKLKSLRVQVENLKEYSFLLNITDKLEHLCIYASRGNCDCQWLTRFEHLQSLYLGKIKKNIEALTGLIQLHTLSLQGITLPSLAFLSRSNVKNLSINWGSMNDLSSLQDNVKIEHLKLWRISKLSDISFLSSLTSLKRLVLDQLRNITALPDLSALQQLTSVELHDMKGLEDIASLAAIDNLRSLRLISAPKIRPEALAPILRNKGLTAIDCFTGIAALDNTMQAMIKQYRH